MHIIIGLGNPGKEYCNTRHNIGFQALDSLAEANKISIQEKKHKALIGKGYIGGHKVILAKPQTYMNLSGESVRELADYYKVSIDNELLVIYDDIDLEIGRLRIRKKGSAGGHNGIKSIISHLGQDTFLRIKIGVGEKPKGYDLADYVLGHFSQEERTIMKEREEDISGAVMQMLDGDTDSAMNRFNKKIRNE